MVPLVLVIALVSIAACAPKEEAPTPEQYLVDLMKSSLVIEPSMVFSSAFLVLKRDSPKAVYLYLRNDRSRTSDFQLVFNCEDSTGNPVSLVSYPIEVKGIEPRGTTIVDVMVKGQDVSNGEYRCTATIREDGEKLMSRNLYVRVI